MIAFRMAAELDMLRPPIVRVHEMPAELAEQSTYAPAMSFPQHATVEQTIDALRQMQPETDSIYYLFVTDFAEHLVGVVSLRQLVTVPPQTQLYEIMDQRVITLSHDASLEEQAHILSQSGLLALPVVDEDGRLIGAMDASDLIKAIEEEATKDMYHLAGMSRDAKVERSLLRVVSDRGFWMAINLLVALVAAWVIASFAGTIASVAVLVAFIPLVVGPGSQAATQTLTLLVRSLTLGEVRPIDTYRVLGRELMTSTATGLGLGVLVGLIVWMWQGSVTLGTIAGVAMLANLEVATLAGVLIPMGLKALRFDPCLASKQSVMAITNVCGLLFLLGLGAVALQMGYL